MTRLLLADTDSIQNLRSLQVLAQSLPTAFLDKARRYHQQQDAYNYIIGRLLLQKAYAIVCHPQPIDWATLQYNKAGKPLLKNLHFSISHSQNSVACAFHQRFDLGLDIEYSRMLPKNHFKHCFDNREWALIKKDASMRTFFEFWTQKEAILKALGLPLNALANIAVKDKQTAKYNYPQAASIELYTKALNLSIPTLFACICSTEAGVLDSVEIKNVTHQLLV